MYFPLHPDTPAEGQTLEELFRGQAYDLEAMHARMKDLMDAEGLPYGHRTYTYDSRLTQELARWANSQPGFEAIHTRLYQSYFVHGQNIGGLNVLVDLAASVGLPAEEARDVLEQRLFKEAVDDDWQKARQYGVTGVPTFVSEGQGVVGAHPYDVLEQLLIRTGVERNSMQ